jgi:hypothetical protein
MPLTSPVIFIAEYDMKKDTYYFPHDSNAQDDEKIIRLRAKFGWEGCGLYWAIIERLRNCPDYKLALATLEGGLSLVLGMDEDKFKSFMDLCFDVRLFEKDEACFWSHSLLQRMDIVDSKRLKLQEAGRKGAETKSLAHATLKPPSSHPQAIISYHTKLNKIKPKEENPALYTEIFKLYQEHFTVGTQHKELTNAHKRGLIRMWKKYPDLSTWEIVFIEANKSQWAIETHPPLDHFYNKDGGNFERYLTKAKAPAKKEFENSDLSRFEGL